MRQILRLCMVLIVFHCFQDVAKLEDFTVISTNRQLASAPSSSRHHENRRQGLGNQKRSRAKNGTYYYNGSQWIVNPWYGWQPNTPTFMECSWEVCLSKNHTCKTCRDSREDLNDNDDVSFSVPHNWIPDVTMLHRMYLDGHDAHGNPWPPPLDDDLCQLLEDHSRTKGLLDAVPIVDAPIPRTTSPKESNNRVLCMIYTMEKSHSTTIRAIRETWAPGCDGFLAFSTQSDPRIPAINIPHEGPEEYHNMWQKIRSMWKFVGQHYHTQFDWFYIGGDDLFVFPQNFKNLLATLDSSQPHYLGKRFQDRQNVSFNSGGAGYALSRPALECLAAHLDDEQCEPRKRSYQEDVLTAECLAKACNITFEDTRDDQQRERFHHFDPESEYDPRVGQQEWYRTFTQNVGGIKLGKDCCAPDTISFHYINNPVLIRYLHHYVHNCNRRIQQSTIM